HHWAIPRPIWKKMQEAKSGVKGDRQGTLDKLLRKPNVPLVFTQDNVLHSVTQFVAVDDQSLSVAAKTTFCNCLVAMHLKSNSQDLPTTHDVASHLHNEFVKWLAQLKNNIEVSVYVQIS
ncbi:hypothetical protein L208DRAFT_1250077, partial [Tricholoma matsutake]